MKIASPSVTKIPSHWIGAVRTIWILLASFYLLTYLVTLPGELTRPVKFTVDNFSGEAWSQEEVEASARELGISPNFLGYLDKYLSIPLFFFYFGVGLLIFWKKSDDWVALVVSLVLMIFSNRTGLLADRFPLFVFISNLTESTNSTLLFLIFMVFPDGHFTPRWMRWVGLYTAIIQVWRLFFEQAYSNFGPALIFPTLLFIAFSQVHRYQRVASPIQRSQIKWVVFINGLGFASLGLVFLSYAAYPQMTIPGKIGLAAFIIGSLVWSLFMILFPVSFALAILSSRLWDIDILIRRTLQYSLLSALLALVYFGGVTVLQSIFTAVTGQQSAASLVLSTLGIAALFNPLRKRIQDFIDKRFYRQKYDAEKALSAFAEAARNETELQSLTTRLTGTVQETLQPAELRLWFRKSTNNERNS